ncbi:MAG: translation initiation factor IF-3 [Bdellovibrionales bacterium]|nr:translation initiation factor IF-3 [Bdellovibrionales bacterium]
MNHEINAPEVRLIDENGVMVGILSPREALGIAEGRGLDLIEIAPTAKPPTCKIMDYGKYKYEEKKKDKAAKKKQVTISVKEIQLRPRTDSHDLDVKLRHAKRFLLDGDKVKFNMRFMGRELAHQELGYNLLKKVSASLLEVALVETPPKMEGKQLFSIYAPDPVKVKEYLKTHKEVKEVKEDKEAVKKESSSSPS